MILTIIVGIVCTVGIVSITLIEEFFLVIDIAIKADIYSPQKEQVCRCRQCLKRKETDMYLDALNHPEAFLKEIAKSNGSSSMALEWGRQLLIEGGVKFNDSLT